MTDLVRFDCTTRTRFSWSPVVVSCSSVKEQAELFEEERPSALSIPEGGTVRYTEPGVGCKGIVPTSPRRSAHRHLEYTGTP
jgi:hypothetical protein